MRLALKTGFSFGLTSGIITTLGLMVGLHSGTHSEMVVIGGILTIAVADAFSDALGIHISQEAQDKHSEKEIWLATIATFLSKLLFALTFILPVLFLELLPAIVVGVIWGLSVLAVFSFLIGKQRGADAWKVVLEHLVIALMVIVTTHFIGDWIAGVFG
jgi:VIT1/CCC1 family predicted Fe2+/Mn2+ transporter